MVAPLAPVYDDLLTFLVEKSTPQEILAYTASDAAQERADDLLERSSAGTLTPEETTEKESPHEALSGCR